MASASRAVLGTHQGAECGPLSGAHCSNDLARLDGLGHVAGKPRGEGLFSVLGARVRRQRNRRCAATSLLWQRSNTAYQVEAITPGHPDVGETLRRVAYANASTLIRRSL